MSSLKISEAFQRYGAKQRNVQWSVSAWNAADELVVCLWTHHRRPGEPNTLEFTDRFSRWGGPGNTELRRNIRDALDRRSRVRLVMARLLSTADEAKVQAGADPGLFAKEYFVRTDLVGEVLASAEDEYSIRFRRA